MPMSFPDMKSLERAAEVWEFRGPKKGESEEDYRMALADFVIPKDRIEGHEIRTGKGWNEWNDRDKTDLFR